MAKGLPPKPLDSWSRMADVGAAPLVVAQQRARVGQRTSPPPLLIWSEEQNRQGSAGLPEPRFEHRAGMTV
jgi:hypothetical protein